MLRARFEPHSRKKDGDALDEFFITEYCRCAVTNEAHVLEALEFAYPELPSTVLPCELPRELPSAAALPCEPPCGARRGRLGALHLGGFSVARNTRWLLGRGGVTHIVNAARGLDLFPDFAPLRERLRQGECLETLYTLYLYQLPIILARASPTRRVC